MEAAAEVTPRTFSSVPLQAQLPTKVCREVRVCRGSEVSGVGAEAGTEAGAKAGAGAGAGELAMEKRLRLLEAVLLFLASTAGVALPIRPSELLSTEWNPVGWGESIILAPSAAGGGGGALPNREAAADGVDMKGDPPSGEQEGELEFPNPDAC